MRIGLMVGSDKERTRRDRDAGVTDLAARVVPLGNDAQTRSESRRRTQEFLASLDLN